MSQDDEVPGGAAPDDRPGSTWQDPDPADTSTTSWMERPTEQVRPDPDTVRLGEQPTTADPLVPPAPPPPPPAWSSPAQPAAPASPAPPPAWGAPPPPPAAPAPAWNSPAGAPPPPPAAPPGGPAAPGAWGQPQWSGQALPGVAGWGAVPQAPKPGVVPLRPLGLGEILDGAISYVRRDPRTVLGIATIVGLVGVVIQSGAILLFGSGFGDLLTDPAAPIDDTQLVSAFSGLLAGSLVAGVVTAVLTIVATGMLTVVMAQAVLGRRVTTRDAWERVKPRFWRLLGLSLLSSLIVGAALTAAIAATVLITIAASQVDGLIAGLVGFAGGLGCIALTAWLYVKLLLAPAALVLERVGVVESLRRSWALVRGAWWRTFGISLLAVIIIGLITQVLGVPIQLLVGLVPALNPDLAVLSVAFGAGLVTLITTIVTLPFQSGVTALLYIDRRIRREGLDLELQRAAAAGA